MTSDGALDWHPLQAAGGYAVTVRFQTVPLSGLLIDDERSFRHVALYHDLKSVLSDDGVTFRIPAESARGHWGRVLFLNLTFWSAAEPSDVLMDDHVAADVVAHAAWHHLARRAFTGAPMSAEALFLGESIASAFDLYLVGRLLGNAPDAEFLATQIPAMAEHATDAGLTDDRFEALLADVSAEPEKAFEDLRALLFDAGTTLLAASSVDDAAARLARFDSHRFGPLLHHYELSNWILYARAYAGAGMGPDPRVRSIDTALRAAPDAIAWLEAHWVRPSLSSAGQPSPRPPV